MPDPSKFILNLGVTRMARTTEDSWLILEIYDSNNIVIRILQSIN